MDTVGFPKTYIEIENELSRIRQALHCDGARPCLIVGNGPSAALPDLSETDLERTTILRANWFFLEEQPTYGRRVDGFFWSVDEKALRRRVATIARHGDYDIRAYFQPFVSSDRRDQAVTDTPLDLLPNFDHWAVIATNPTLARFMMGRPLPTQGMQMIAFAAALGFRDIRVAGIDLYSDPSQRYAYTIPDEIKAKLPEKDVAGGYEAMHSLDLDLHFLSATREQYPLRLTGLSRMERLAPYLDATHTGRSRPSLAAVPSATPRKRAFVTLADGAYTIGARVLARSLARVSDVPLIVLHTEAASVPRLQGLPNVELRRVEPIRNPFDHGQKRFAATFTKLRAFEMHEIDRLVFIDADCVVLRNVDALFETEGFAAAPDWGFELTERFNSGVFAVSPSPEFTSRLFSKLVEPESDDGGDQGFLNQALGDEVRMLPPEYNALKRIFIRHPNLVSLSDTRILHFVGRKPWDRNGVQPEYEMLCHRWASFMEREDWAHLYWMQRAEAVKAAQRAAERPKTTPTVPGSESKAGSGSVSGARRKGGFEERLASYDPVRRGVVSLGRRILPPAVAKPVYNALRRVGVL
ncbi:MAG: alpha-2,3-sialyltransferase [Pseudomonadota bacterium]